MLKQKHKYQEARIKFNEALAKFQLGFNASHHDRRFKRSIETTEKNIQDINNEIKKLQLNSEQHERNDTDKPIENREEKTEGVFETLN